VRPVLVLQHRPWEHPGLVRTALGDVPVVTRTVLDDADAADELADLGAVEDLGGVVVMGGPMGALDDAEHPGLAHERRLLSQAVDAGVPVLGVCLGMQLLAVALGADLTPAATHEVGLGPLRLTAAGAADPLLGPVADVAVLHWHDDVVSLPPGATLLASTPATPVQAFRVGSAVGLQLHVEVDVAHLETWLQTPAMVGGMSEGEVGRLRAEGRRLLPATSAAALQGLASFAADVRARRERAGRERAR